MHKSISDLFHKSFVSTPISANILYIANIMYHIVTTNRMNDEYMYENTNVQQSIV